MSIISDKHIRQLLRIIVLLVISSGIYSCEKPCRGPKKVFIVYSIGYNNLSDYLKTDIKELSQTYSSAKCSNHVVIFEHSVKSRGDYSTPNSPILYELTRDKSGNVGKNILLTMDPNTVSASSETLREVLECIRNKYNDAEYSILFSSHGTGWVPVDYCNMPDYYENLFSDYGPTMRVAGKRNLPYWGVLPADGGPVVKSFGVQNITSNTYHEMDITDMADAFPMKMQTVIFDACFMGSIEVAYEFRDVTESLIASQTEILADGMDYETMLKYVFNNDFKGFCKNFFDHYNNLSGSYRSATISLIDCTRLEPLAYICREIFESQRHMIASLEGSMEVQRYYRLANSTIHKWFYDLEDIAVKSGISDAQADELRTALEGCILYKAATERFIEDISITNHSGLSMYLPYKDRAYLNNFYKKLEWNKATGLVQ